MNDIAQTSLKEAEHLNWDQYDTGGSKYQAPPPALDAAGKPITYYGVVPTIKEDNPDDGYLNLLLDPIKITKPTNEGYEIRFTRASVKKFTKKLADGSSKILEASKLGNFLRACGIPAKPQSNAEYLAAARACQGKQFGFVIDWEAYNKDTQESIKGYNSFPDDPERPGQKKSILHKGDLYNLLDNKGKPTGQFGTVQSEVIFANARHRYFVDAAPRR